MTKHEREFATAVISEPSSIDLSGCITSGGLIEFYGLLEEEDEVVNSEEIKAWNERVDLDRSIKKNKAKRVSKYSKSRSL